MANGFTVRPGDLITAAAFNHLIDGYDDLLQRVIALEGQIVQPGTGVTVQPLGHSVEVGDEITVIGTHFAQPVALNVVMFGTTRITQFNPGTDDHHLVFNVPPVTGLPRDVTFSVTNSTGSASMQITVLATTNPVPIGSLVISPVPTSPGVIQVGQTFTFPFTVDSQTNIPETYSLVVLYNQVVGSTPNAWSQATSIRNQSNQSITGVTVANGSPVTVNVRVTVPAGATRANLTLQALSQHAPSDPLLNTSSMLSIVVGQAPVVSDPRVSFEQLLVAPANRLQNDPALGQVIRTPVGNETLVRVTANFDITGTYAFSGRAVPEDLTLWTVTRDPSTPASNAQGPGNPRDIIVRVAALAADNVASRTLEIHAARTGPGETFDSWFSVAIQNS
jgi:hypothetical protein